MSEDESRRGVIAWFACNDVAANLLMITIVVTGILVARNIRQEVYPVFELNTVEIDMDYRGASPEEVERSVILPIEAELRGMELVRRIESVAREGNGRVEVEVMPGFDRNRALQEVTAAVQRVSLFPDEVEPPVITLEKQRLTGTTLERAVEGTTWTQRQLQAFAKVQRWPLETLEAHLKAIRGEAKPGANPMA